MRLPQQALIKDSIRGPPIAVNDGYMGQGALNLKALRREISLPNFSNSVTPRRNRLPMMKTYRNERKDRGLGTDSFLLEQGQ